MKKLFFILTIFICSAVFFQSAAEAKSACSRRKIKPQIEFQTSYGKLRYEFGFSRDQIIDIAHRSGAMESSIFLAGLATVKVEQHYRVATTSEILKDGTICIFPSKITVYVGYKNPVIYIANDLKPGTCEYNQILRHEQAHQQINIAVLKYFIPIFKESAAKIASDIKPIKIKRAKQSKGTAKIFLNSFEKKFKPLVNIMEEERGIEQGKLDNDYNYGKEAQICAEYNRKKIFHSKKRR